METQLLNLYTVKEKEGVWGLKSLLRTVNIQSLHKYRWMVDDLTPKRDNLFQMEGYSVRGGGYLVWFPPPPHPSVYTQLCEFM